MFAWALGAPPESQAELTSPYPPPEAQSRGKPSRLVAWAQSAWDFLVDLFGGGTQTALAAGLHQDNPPEPPELIEYSYDVENRLVSVSAGEMAASFIYDRDRQRVASVIAGEVTVYIGEVFEWDVTSSSMTRYYYAGTQRVAVRIGSAAPVWLLGDHLGSTSVAANTDGSLLSRQGYLPWGELRFAEGSLPGRYQFTGQASYEAEFGLYYYKARWYDPSLGRWASPDSVVPLATQGVQAWDRYAYVNNSPVNATDPTGHLACWDDNANDTGCEQYTPTGYGLLLENPSPSQGTPPTLTDKIRQGDTSALVQLLTPSHIGGRLQFEGSFILIIGVSVSVGVNGVYNRNSDELAANVDWAIEGGGGLGVGASGTGGALIGWGSSDIDDATKGFSGIISGTVAAEGAASAALTTPIDEKGFHVDPYSGQVPFTIYFGGGAGGGYAGIGGGVNGPTGIYVNLTRFLPWHWFK